MSKPLSKSIKFVQKYMKIDDLILKDLAEFGVMSIKTKFANADYQRSPQINVYYKISGNELTLYADGEDVAFIEFGAGVRFGNGYSGPKPSGIVPIGTYGKGYGSNPEGWYYRENGTLTHTYGNPPAEAMYGTLKEIAERVLTYDRLL